MITTPPELLNDLVHPLALPLHVVAVREEEDPDLALGELHGGLEEVGQQEGEAPVVVEPVHVDGAVLAGAAAELLDLHGKGRTVVKDQSLN